MTLKNKIMAACLAATMVIGLSGCSDATASEVPVEITEDVAVVEEVVLPTIDSISADELTLDLNGEATANLNATVDAVIPDGGEIVFEYNASNDTIEVDPSGNVTAVSVGTITPFVTITAKYDSDGDGEADSGTLATEKVAVTVIDSTEETTDLDPQGEATEMDETTTTESSVTESTVSTETTTSATATTDTSSSTSTSDADAAAQAEADAQAAADAAAAQAAADAAAAQAAADAAAAQAAADAAAAQAAADAAAAQAENEYTTKDNGGVNDAPINTVTDWSDYDVGVEDGSWSPFG